MKNICDIIRNAYDFLQNTQCYATGGFGPAERIMPTNGNLGKALDYHQNTCETPCCSWAAFKLARYLMQFTGEARYGDWIERLIYNGIGGILPITGQRPAFLLRRLSRVRRRESLCARSVHVLLRHVLPGRVAIIRIRFITRTRRVFT